MAAQRGNPGRYDQIAERALGDTKARVVAVIVLDGDKGNGFSVAGHSTAAVEAAKSGELSSMLRAMADIIETHPPDGVRVSYES